MLRPKIDRPPEAISFAIGCVFGALLLLTILVFGWLRPDLPSWIEKRYVQTHGKIASAQIIEVAEEDYLCSKVNTCPGWRVYYRFLDSDGVPIDGDTWYGSRAKALERKSFNIYYLPADPSRQVPTDNIPSMAEFFVGPVLMLAAALFALNLARITLRGRPKAKK